MVVTTSTDLFVEFGFILSGDTWTTSRIALARKLTSSTSLHERCPWHTFCRRSDQVFWSTPLLTKNKCDPNTGFACVETSNPENIPLETSRSEFPFVFSRTVSGPST